MSNLPQLQALVQNPSSLLSASDPAMWRSYHQHLLSYYQSRITVADQPFINPLTNSSELSNRYTLHYLINVALFLLIFAEISCATFISQAQLLFIFKNFECATFIRLRYICFTAWCFINNRLIWSISWFQNYCIVYSNLIYSGQYTGN